MYETPFSGVAYLEAAFSPIYNEKEEISGYIIQMVNVTREREYQIALEKSEIRYRSFVENIQGLAFQSGLEWNLDFFHGVVEEITGYTEDEFVAGGITWNQVVHPEDLYIIMDVAERLVREPNFIDDREYRIIMKNGETRWIHEIVKNVCDESGHPFKIIGTMIDITEKRNALIKLRESEEQLRNLTEQSSDGIILADQSGIVVTWNRKIEEITGINSADVIGQPIWDVYVNIANPELLSDEFIRQTQEYTQRMLETGKSGESDDEGILEIFRPDGTTRKVHGAPFPIKTEKGHMLASFIRDVTDYELMRSDVERQKDELSKFAHNIAHDLRASIQPIVGYADLLQEKYNPSWAMEISQTAKRMSNLLDQTLVLADAGRIVGEPVEVDPRELLEEVVKIAVPENVSFKHDEPPLIKCDRQKIFQVFQNLIVNAIDHGKANAIEMSIKKDRTGISIFLSNNGRLIPKEHRPRIFDHGFSTKQGGGLGLSITKRIVEAHGWTIDLMESEKTTFRITIPNSSIVE